MLGVVVVIGDSFHPRKESGAAPVCLHGPWGVCHVGDLGSWTLVLVLLLGHAEGVPEAVCEAIQEGLFDLHGSGLNCGG